MPASGLLVSNHLSYLDVVVLSSIRPCFFVAKRDVATWPLFGWLAHAAGTIFVDREHRLSSMAVVSLIRKAIACGSVVVLFPEGTSTDGSAVLPFKSALLESAVQIRCPVAAGSIEYALDDGPVADGGLQLARHDARAASVQSFLQTRNPIQLQFFSAKSSVWRSQGDRVRASR
jgi:1-acyl-sn-glycerol-3-phosphate acyltransferase